MSYNAIFLRTWIYIQLILEFKNSFGKYHSVFPKNPWRAFFYGHPVYITYIYLYIFRVIYLSTNLISKKFTLYIYKQIKNLKLSIYSSNSQSSYLSTYVLYVYLCIYVSIYLSVEKLWLKWFPRGILSPLKHAIMQL